MFRGFVSLKDVFFMRHIYHEKYSIKCFSYCSALPTIVFGINSASFFQYHKKFTFCSVVKKSNCYSTNRTPQSTQIRQEEEATKERDAYFTVSTEGKVRHAVCFW